MQPQQQTTISAFSRYVSNFVRTALSSISPNKVLCYNVTQFEAEYQDWEQLHEQKSTYYFYKVANHYDMVYLPGAVAATIGSETPYAYSLFRFQGEEEIGMSAFYKYVEVLDPLHSACITLGITMDRCCLEKITTFCRTQVGWNAAHVAAALCWKDVFLSPEIKTLMNSYDRISQLTPLRIAIDSLNFDLVQFLLDLDGITGAEVDDHGNTVFHAAARHSSKNILSLLLAHVTQVNVNSLNKLGETALHIACQNVSLDCVRELLCNNANPFVGLTDAFPIHLAVMQDSIDCVNLLCEYFPEVVSMKMLSSLDTPLHLAHNSKFFERLCELGADLDAQNALGLTVLHIKVRENNFTDVLNLLIRGADVDLGDVEGATPLHYAMNYNSSVDIIRALLVFEANPNALNINGHTPRHLLCRHSESYIHSADRDLALYTLNAVGARRCPAWTNHCTAGCIDPSKAKQFCLDLFDGIPPEISIRHSVDHATDVIEEVLLSVSSPTFQRSDTSNFQPNNRLSNMPEVDHVDSSTMCNNDDFDTDLVPSSATTSEITSMLSSWTPSKKPGDYVDPGGTFPSNPSCTTVFTLNDESTVSIANSTILAALDSIHEPVCNSSSGNVSPSPSLQHIPTHEKIPAVHFFINRCTCDLDVRPHDHRADRDSKSGLTYSHRYTFPTSLDRSQSHYDNRLASYCFNSDSELIDYSSCDDIESKKTRHLSNHDHLTELNNRDCYKLPFLTSSSVKQKEKKKWNCGKNGYRVLSLDGGGVRGLIIVQILRNLEKISGKQATDLFDWIIGTSTGAAISLYLAKGKCLHCCRRLLFRFKDTVFCGKRPYPSECLESLMRQEFGDHTVMTDLKKVRVAVTTLISDRCPPILHMFRNYKSPRIRMQQYMEKLKSRSASCNTNGSVCTHTRSASNAGITELLSPKSSTNISTSQSILNFFMTGQVWNLNESTNVSSCPENGDRFEPIPLDSEQYVWKAARASGAAPTYFRPCGVFLDGGLISNNPTLDILTEIQELQVAQRFKNKAATPIAVVVSIGTGRMPVYPVETVDVFRPQNIIETYRSVRGVSYLGRILVEAATMSEGPVVDRARAWCASLGVSYFRFSPPLSMDVSLDSTDTKLLVQMVWETEVYLHQQRERIERLASMLIN